MEFVAVDIGTSFTKGAIVNVETLEIREVCRRPAPQPLPSIDPLFCELDPEQIVHGVKEVIDELALKSPSCAGVLMCGQMGGLVLTSADGVALRPYISWLDRRATQPYPGSDGTYFDVLSETVGLASATVLGNEFRPGLSLSFLFWLKETGQLDVLNSAVPVTLPDYVAAALCGVRPVMEWTSTTGLLDISERNFPRSMFAKVGLGDLDLPQIVDFRHCVGQYSVSAGTALPVYAPTGDHQCSLAGTLLSEGELSINISTGSQVAIITGDTTVGDFQIRPYFDGHLLRTITNIPAGRALNSVMQLLTEISGDSNDSPKAWDYFFERAERTESSDVDINLAFFPGAVSGPGSIGNLREDNLTVGHVARASLEQMVVYYEQMATRIAPERDWSQIAFSGGLAQQSEFMRRLIVERLQSSSRTATSTEDALFGMMVLGRVISGLNNTVAEASQHVAQNS